VLFACSAVRRRNALLVASFLVDLLTMMTTREAYILHHHNFSISQQLAAVFLIMYNDVAPHSLSSLNESKQKKKQATRSQRSSSHQLAQDGGVSAAALV
jgi:hypothetical protein